MGHKAIDMTAGHSHLAPTHERQTLESLARPGSVPVSTGRKMATRAKAARTVRKLNRTQLKKSN